MKENNQDCPSGVGEPKLKDKSIPNYAGDFANSILMDLRSLTSLDRIEEMCRVDNQIIHNDWGWNNRFILVKLEIARSLLLLTEDELLSSTESLFIESFFLEKFIRINIHLPSILSAGELRQYFLKQGMILIDKHSWNNKLGKEYILYAYVPKLRQFEPSAVDTNPTLASILFMYSFDEIFGV